MHGYTKCQVEQFKSAQVSQKTTGNTSTQDLNNMVHGNIIKKFTVTVSNIDTEEKIFGPNLDSLRGKTVQNKPEKLVPTI